MPNIPHNYSITFRAASLLGSQCCVLRYAAAPLTPGAHRGTSGQPVWGGSTGRGSFPGWTVCGRAHGVVVLLSDYSVCLLVGVRRAATPPMVGGSRAVEWRLDL